MATEDEILKRVAQSVAEQSAMDITLQKSEYGVKFEAAFGNFRGFVVISTHVPITDFPRYEIDQLIASLVKAFKDIKAAHKNVTETRKNASLRRMAKWN